MRSALQALPMVWDFAEAKSLGEGHSWEMPRTAVDIGCFRSSSSAVERTLNLRRLRKWFHETPEVGQIRRQLSMP